MNIRSKVMTIANALVRQGVSRSAAMVRAWITVKMKQFYIKAVGVTHSNRQTLLDHLTRCKPEDITITLQREKDNAHDSNAIQIIAAVRNKGSAVVGYVNKELAEALAPLTDKGLAIASGFKAITGGGALYINYGLNLVITV